MTKVIYTNLAPADGFTLCQSIVLIKPAFKSDLALLSHEMVHVGQMQKVGTIKWWWKYLSSSAFRQAQEVEAYKVQIAKGLPKEKAAKFLIEIDRVPLSYEDALALFS